MESRESLFGGVAEAALGSFNGEISERAAHNDNCNY